MDELEDRLRGITLAEPPLGFDPDEVAGKAAKKARNRRGVVATGIATLAVIAAAVVFVAPGNGPAPAVPPIPVAPSPSGAPSPAPANGDLAARKARISGHLAIALPGVLTGAMDVRIRSVHQLGTWDALVFMIGYRDASGADRPLLLTVLGVEAAKRGFSLEDSCKPGRRPRGGFDADLGGVTSGEPVDCVKLLQPDRSTVVVTGTVPSLPPGDVEPGRDAIAYRADGTVVAVSTGAGDGGSRPPDDQLIKLVSDPELDLR
ncbi:hypothetical protein [Amycolatopsis keratiniphila]|uniref:Uncharacterized protein n=1 Tax=Amycolatopsis keratiniphila subsp. keratiniphila TaxID=227715 RepID=A0A1W2LZ47_9PSEU|nr:hypothetical protein [Amycolatopsis keratiniphila]OLZ58833.1 hypothetical protein BS330_10515 [Amycolatopsis keratiniphila subsp. nogabecina]ONF72503.1 hypothetical protein AVR91_0209905 [Amycolatopsis keratiniphila subsp. keratiniphila]SDU70012.1 hypothetical protein SAMN04489733_8619 [Amycolatopsis keratiniphila]